MKSYKNKRVRSRKNKSRRYSRKRKGGKIEIDATKDYKMFKFPGCKDLKNKVLKIKQENPNETFTFSNKAEEQITKCNSDQKYRDQILSIIAPTQSNVIKTPITQENEPQYQVISEEELKEANRQLDQQAADRRNEMNLEQIAKARAKLGLPFISGEIPTTMVKSASSEISVGPRDPGPRDPILNAASGRVPGPYDGGKKRRHRRKSRKHSRRH